MAMKAAMIGRVWVHIIPMRDEMKIENKGRIYIEMENIIWNVMGKTMNYELIMSCIRLANSTRMNWFPLSMYNSEIFVWIRFK